MHVDDLLHRFLVGEADVVEEAAAQERVGQLLLVVAGDDDDRPLLGANGLARLVDVELHLVEFAQQIVRKLDVGLVDFVDQQHRRGVGFEGFPELALDDVVADVLDLGIAELRIAQARHRVVFVEAVLGLGRRFDAPVEEGLAERIRHFARELGLAGARLALDQQRAPEHDRGVHGHGQVIGGDVVFGAFEAHGTSFSEQGDARSLRIWGPAVLVV